MISSGVVDSIQSVDLVILVKMIEGWRQFVKIWRKIHRFIGPGFSGFPLRWFCEVAKIWGTDSANPLDVDDHKDFGTDQFRFPLTGCSTYFCWPEKSATGDRRRVRDIWWQKVVLCWGGQTIARTFMFFGLVLKPRFVIKNHFHGDDDDPNWVQCCQMWRLGSQETATDVWELWSWWSSWSSKCAKWWSCWSCQLIIFLKIPLVLDNENFDQKNQTDQVGRGDFEHSDGHCDN